MLTADKNIAVNMKRRKVAQLTGVVSGARIGSSSFSGMTLSRSGSSLEIGSAAMDASHLMHISWYHRSLAHLRGSQLWNVATLTALLYNLVLITVR